MPLLTAADYEALDVIGHGSFGTIRRVKRKQDGMVLVRKEISYIKMSNTEKTQLAAEFEILSSLDNPNIVRYYHRDHLKNDGMVHLYMEYCGNGDLGGVIKRCRNNGNLVPENYIWAVAVQLIAALYRCHNGVNPPVPQDAFASANSPPPSARIEGNKNLIKILHRDLKPENIFVMEDNSIKVGDFGLAKRLAPGQNFAETYAGTPYYMSPEISMGRAYTAKSDIWSMGCILYELCAREPPFREATLHNLVNKICKGEYKPIPSSYSNRLAELIRMCLCTDPAERADTAKLLEVETVKLFRHELKVIEHRQMLKIREKETARKEALVESKAKELEHMYCESKRQIEADISRRLRIEWEMRAEQVIRQKVDMERNNIKREIEAQLVEEFNHMVEMEVQNRIARMDLVPRTLISRPDSGFEGSAGPDSGFEGSLSSPARSHFPTLIPDSPADIMMESPSAHMVATPGQNLSKAQMLRGPPPKMPLSQFNTGSFENAIGVERKNALIWTDTLTPLPDNQNETSSGLLARQPLKPPTNGLLNLAAKRNVLANANGSPTRINGRIRAGLQRAETTGGDGVPTRLIAGFGINGTGSTDDIATVKPNTSSPVDIESRTKPKSLFQISQESRGPLGPPPIWAKENPKDLPSPFKKS